MKKGTKLAITFVAAIATTAPVLAQETLFRQGNETAAEMANRLGRCDGLGGLRAAQFGQNAAGQTTLEVSCVQGAGLDGGLSTAAVAGGFIVVGLVALGLGGGTSSTTGTN